MPCTTHAVCNVLQGRKQPAAHHRHAHYGDMPITRRWYRADGSITARSTAPEVQQGSLSAYQTLLQNMHTAPNESNELLNNLLSVTHEQTRAWHRYCARLGTGCTACCSRVLMQQCSIFHSYLSRQRPSLCTLAAVNRQMSISAQQTH
jgi:hypothetical protein